LLAYYSERTNELKYLTGKISQPKVLNVARKYNLLSSFLIIPFRSYCWCCGYCIAV